MKIVTSPAAMARRMEELRRRGKRIAFVPTMGALHAGHLSLVRAALRITPHVVVSIFVNPTQFGPKEDFAKYPRTWKADTGLLRAAGVETLYAPEVNAIYPPGFETYVTQEKLPTVLCGASRPGHFRGVLTVVLKLFQVVRPHVALFGQKDYQQTVVIRRMARDLDLPVRIRVCPIVREADGLALSSRNVYLSAADRARAPVLYRTLRDAERRIRAGERSAARVLDEMRKAIAATPGARIDYVAAVDPDSLAGVTRTAPPVVLALAVKFGATRLIDNVVVR